MRKILAIIGLVLGLAVPATALAASGAGGSTVTLAKGDNRTGTYYAAGQNVTINGNVEGDVICGGQIVEINGSVGGDVLCASQNITINGPVGGSVRVVGQNVTINGTVGRNVTAAGQTLTLGSNAHVSGEVAVAGQTMTLGSTIDHDAVVGGMELALGGSIGGDLTYYSNDTFSIDRTKVAGTITHRVPEHQARQSNPVASQLRMLLYWLVAGLFVTLVLVWVMPRFVRTVATTMMTQIGRSFGWGALALIAIPVVMFLVSLTVIGIPLAVLLGILWVAAILSAELFAGVAVGMMALGRKETGRKAMVLATLAGVPLVMVLGWLPFVGVFVKLAAVMWSLGGLTIAANKARTAR
ncbi:MAG TPA: polymer-forming cytoskeletal protein [Candidatus Saccharimonadia bacterium]|jgi:cytoskeletal protein CcmA (bactofilin family)|nr:polymer-forming cytoskeletal protein [Candidatus Saccharimonadia bacterium]